MLARDASSISGGGVRKGISDSASRFGGGPVGIRSSTSCPSELSTGVRNDSAEATSSSALPYCDPDEAADSSSLTSNGSGFTRTAAGPISSGSVPSGSAVSASASNSGSALPATGTGPLSSSAVSVSLSRESWLGESEKSELCADASSAKNESSSSSDACSALASVTGNSSAW